MNTIKYVKDYTKESYKKAICEACDDLKSRIDDILCDFDKHIMEINITIKVGYGQVSVINISKEMCVEGEGEDNE